MIIYSISSGYPVYRNWQMRLYDFLSAQVGRPNGKHSDWPLRHNLFHNEGTLDPNRGPYKSNQKTKVSRAKKGIAKN